MNADIFLRTLVNRLEEITPHPVPCTTASTRNVTTITGKPKGRWFRRCGHRNSSERVCAAKSRPSLRRKQTTHPHPHATRSPRRSNIWREAQYW